VTVAGAVRGTIVTVTVGAFLAIVTFTSGVDVDLEKLLSEGEGVNTASMMCRPAASGAAIEEALDGAVEGETMQGGTAPDTRVTVQRVTFGELEVSM
jgi:hypothetical protein